MVRVKKIFRFFALINATVTSIDMHFSSYFMRTLSRLCGTALQKKASNMSKAKQLVQKAKGATQSTTVTSPVKRVLEPPESETNKNNSNKIVSRLRLVTKDDSPKAIQKAAMTMDEAPNAVDEASKAMNEAPKDATHSLDVIKVGANESKSSVKDSPADKGGSLPAVINEGEGQAEAETNGLALRRSSRQSHPTRKIVYADDVRHLLLICQMHLVLLITYGVSDYSRGFWD